MHIVFKDINSYTFRIRPLAQYCFIFMYGTIVTLGLLANVAVLVAFVSKKVKISSDMTRDIVVVVFVVLIKSILAIVIITLHLLALYEYHDTI